MTTGGTVNNDSTALSISPRSSRDEKRNETEELESWHFTLARITLFLCVCARWCVWSVRLTLLHLARLHHSHTHTHTHPITDHVVIPHHESSVPEIIDQFYCWNFQVSVCSLHVGCARCMHVCMCVCECGQSRCKRPSVSLLHEFTDPKPAEK